MISSDDDGITPFLRAFTAVEWLVLVVAGLGAFFGPVAINAIWAWDIRPFNAAFIGTIYLASVPAIGAVAWTGSWSPTRIVLPMLLVFTGIGAVATAIEWDRLLLARWSAWAWVFLYLSLPMNSAAHLWLYRGRPANAARDTPRGWRMVLRAQAAVLCAYGVALFAVPNVASAFWPWPLDAFHARLYSGAFLALGIGGWLIADRAARRDWLAQGWTQLAFGVLGITGVVWVDSTAHRVPWSAVGTWAWMAAFAAFAAAGACLLLGRSVPPR